MNAQRFSYTETRPRARLSFLRLARCFLATGLTALGLAGFCVADTGEPPDRGLTVAPGGGLLKYGTPFRGIGINYFNAFSRTLADPNDTSYRDGFAVLAEHHIPFIRFMACGFWPNDWALYREDRSEYFRRMDTFVKAAEEYGIGLIPSLFWYDSTVPDLVGEPRSQWGNPESKTMAFMRRYVDEVVPRYNGSPAIWAWELGNEYSLDADLPNAAEHRPAIVPHWGTPTTRSEADDLTHDMLVSAFVEFAKAVRKHDRTRPVTPGNSLPRPAAHHMRTERSWTHDSREQFAANLLAVTPDPMNMASIHLYTFDQERFGEQGVTFESILALAMKATASAGKALFVGEFGASDAAEAGGPEAAQKTILSMIEAIERSGVSFAALWVFDLAQQNDTLNVTATNHRAYLLDALAKANRRMQGGKDGAR